MAVDLLYFDRRDMTVRPLRDRRARLEDVVAGSELVFPVRRLAPDGLEAWAQVIERGSAAGRWRQELRQEAVDPITAS
jgi:ATP-dependent DNA ligase